MMAFKVANVDQKCYSAAFFVGKKEMKVRHLSRSVELDQGDLDVNGFYPWLLRDLTPTGVCLLWNFGI